MVLASFLVNLLCAITTCSPNFGLPGDNSKESSILSTFRNFRNFHDPRPPELIVETEEGKVEGYIMKTISGRQIYAFKEIPFAEAPVGQRRFRPPVLKKSWEGVKKAQKSAPCCLQMHTFFLNRIFGQEDCLMLNLYTPQLPAENKPKRSVLIFIHGGSFQFGGAREYGPAYLLEKDVIVVLINFRLGILGFLSTGDEASTGNNGLRDQELAIQWVHRNIENFGGDKSRVTLMGQSGGGCSVHLHMLSQRPTRNYFRNAIILSGTAFNFWAVQSPRLAKMWTMRAAELAHCDPEMNSQSLMECLRSVNPVSLVANQFQMQDYYPSYPSIFFGPTIEKNHSEAVITETPAEIYKRDGVSKIPLIISNTDGEGEVAIITLPTIFRPNPFRTQWKKLAPIFLDYKDLENINQNVVTNAVEEFYFKNETNAKTVPLTSFSNMTTDRYFLPGIHSTLRAHSSVAPTYSLLFSYKGRFGIPAAFGFSHSGFRVSHSEDLFYVFNMSQFSQGLQVTQPEYQISKFMTDWIVNFADTGVPVNETDFKWPPIVDPDNIQQLSVDEVVSLTPFPEASLKAGFTYTTQTKT